MRPVGIFPLLVCVCVRDRERERGAPLGVRARVCVSVCLREQVCV